jgi:hypothetical protein
LLRFEQHSLSLANQNVGIGVIVLIREVRRMRPLHLILLLIPSGVAFRYCVELTQAARVIGISLLSPAYLSVNKNGLQNAVTPPELNEWFLLTMALQIGAVGWLWLAFGWANALIGAVVAFLSGTVAQATFLPKRDSRHFVLRISRSMARRVADYERDGDAVRARAMKAVLDKVVAQYAGVIAKTDKTATVQERIISKPDADMIFAFTRAEWERYARQVTAPEGWTLRLQPFDTGTMIARFNQSTGIGKSVQALFINDQGPPIRIFVGNYYPVGFMRISREVVKHIEQATRLDLGPAYSVWANTAAPAMPDANLEAIELIVTPDAAYPHAPKEK